jgi:His-Xaa-Ser system radical SAM maturase HxsB
MSTAKLFRPREAFAQGDGPYQLLPFRFMRWTGGESLLVNEVGEFLFVDDGRVEELIDRRLAPTTPEYKDLLAKHFLTDGDPTLAIELLATKYRTKKSFLDGFTKLHLFVVTLRCDHSCRYCQVSRVSADRSRYDMSEETALRAIDLLFRSPSNELKVELQGGESLLAFDRIRYVVEEIERRNASVGKQIEFVVATNLVPLTDEMLDFFRVHGVYLSTSLDGPAALHDRNRPRPGKDSYRQMVRNLARAREALGHDRISAVMTTTEASLEQPRAIVDEYVDLGFDAVFLRPISPYGFAMRTGEAGRYQPDQFLSFYKEALDHIIESNRAGVDFVEVYAQILLNKILTPLATGYVDLQSPAGTVLGAVAYNYDGSVYASDEGRMLGAMGDQSFRLGDVHTDSYEEIFGGQTSVGLAMGSVHETMPGCAECAFAPYCGTDPVFHYRTQGDIVGHRPTSGFCAKNMAIIRHLFQLLRGDDPFIRELLVSWATGVPLPGPAAGEVA